MAKHEMFYHKYLAITVYINVYTHTSSIINLVIILINSHNQQLTSKKHQKKFLKKALFWEKQCKTQ